jgi:hypothetical protein
VLRTNLKKSSASFLPLFATFVENSATDSSGRGDFFWATFEFCGQYFCQLATLKLTGVLSGNNQQLMICQSVAWYFLLNLRSLRLLNLNKRFSAAL